MFSAHLDEPWLHFSRLLKQLIIMCSVFISFSPRWWVELFPYYPPHFQCDIFHTQQVHTNQYNMSEAEFSLPISSSRVQWKSVRSISVLCLIRNLQSPGHRQATALPSLFHRYYFGFCPSEFDPLATPSYDLLAFSYSDNQSLVSNLHSRKSTLFTRASPYFLDWKAMEHSSSTYFLRLTISSFSKPVSTK